MKVSLLIILCLCIFSWGSIVIKVPKDQENEKTFLFLKENIDIGIPITFCIRFNLMEGLSTAHQSITKPIFCSMKMAIKLRFSVNLGSLFINDEYIAFKIPEANGVQPFSWQHFCLALNDQM